MCYSERASWIALGVSVAGLAAFVVARHPHQPMISSLHDVGETAALTVSLACIVVIQLFEAIMWRNQRRGDLGDGTAERYTMVIASLQPLAVA